jgi:hypothetical protein
MKKVNLKAMRIIAPIMVLIFLLGTMSFIMPGKVHWNAAAKAPKIVFSETKHDFGKVPQGPQLTYSFKFKNKGKETLQIKDVITSCGCTGATVGNKTEYEKNEKGEISVTFNTQGREGHQEKNIIVKSNDPFSPEVVLTINCEIDPNMQ